MADVAKVFMSGRSQAVRLPKAYRFDCDEVEIAREGEAVVLRPRMAAPWSKLKAALEGFDEAELESWFPDGRQQPAEQERSELERLFEP